MDPRFGFGRCGQMSCFDFKTYLAADLDNRLAADTLVRGGPRGGLAGKTFDSSTRAEAGIADAVLRGGRHPGENS